MITIVIICLPKLFLVKKVFSCGIWVSCYMLAQLRFSYNFKHNNIFYAFVFGYWNLNLVLKANCQINIQIWLYAKCHIWIHIHKYDKKILSHQYTNTIIYKIQYINTYLNKYYTKKNFWSKINVQPCFLNYKSWKI